MGSTHQESPGYDDYKSNIALSYEYLGKSIAEVKSNIDSINTRLGLIVGLDATFIRFSSGLPDQVATVASVADYFLVCYSCLILKVLFCVCLSISIGLAVWGLFPVKVSTTLTPKQLLDNASLAYENDYKLAIIYFWDKIIPELLRVRDQKSSRLRYAIILFAIAAFISALDVMIASIFKY
ncbi:MAG TPA: hypothetical protein V6D31_10115 [Candidatus Sericytochromatia bacterium]